MNKRYRTVSAAAFFTGLLLSSTAMAQLPGQHINSNVTILLDTGRGMNWTKTASTSEESDERTNQSESLCENMNKQDYTGDLGTTWQLVLQALLGTVPASYDHCFYEEAGIRPALMSGDAIGGLDETITSNEGDHTDYMKKLTAEYWEFSREPHFRLINCRDPRKAIVGGRGDWNTTYNQCVGTLPDDPTGGEEIVTRTGRRYWCEHMVNGQKNLYKYTDSTGLTQTVCLNLNPLAQDRHTDGVLEQQRTLARFGLMTFDNLPAPARSYWDSADKAVKQTTPWDVLDEHRSGWDFGRDVRWFITAYEQRRPNDTSYLSPIPATSASRYWNAGVRAPNPAAVGRMVPISEDFESSNQDVRNVLNTVEPNHCSFDAAMFDDAGYYFYNAAETRPAYNLGSDLYFNCRPRIVFFITDGVQTDALEFPQQYCNKDGQDGETNAPPPPWDDFDNAKIFNCPFNSTIGEVDEMFKVVSKLASGDPNIQPMYLVVIGVNMKPKEGTSQNRCDVTNAEWREDPMTGIGYCPVPEDDCITLRELNESECVNNPESTLKMQVWVTPRQYLNMLALKGWPEDSGGLYSFETAGGRFRQPPWRPQADGTLESDFCDADNSNCGGETDDGEADGALFVDSVTNLTKVINMVLQSVAPETAGTRTEITTATNPDANVEATDAAAQFMMNSGYRSSTGGPWKGYLYRQGQKCTYYDDSTNNSTGGAIGDAAAFHSGLQKQAESGTRNIYIRDPDADYSDLEYTNLEVFRDGKPEVLVKYNEAGNLFDNDLGITESGAEGNTDYVAMVQKYLYGSEKDTPRGDHPLGDIYNSTPAVLARPTERVPLASYQKFQTEKWAATGGDIYNPDKPMSTRDPLLYVGTNDGILHSFNLMAGIREGLDLDSVEGWGFVPTTLLETIGKQFPINIKRTYEEIPEGSGQWVSKYNVEEISSSTDTGYQHMFGVDAPPLAADVLLYRDPEAVTTADKSEEKFWRSIVLGGLGKGGYGYYALDVTRGPQHRPVYRWELSPDEFGTNAPKFPPSDEDPSSDEALSRIALGKMGMGLTRPELAYVYINNMLPGSTSAKDQQIAVAILPGGYKSNEAGGIGVSTGVYIVRVGDGKLIRYLDPSNDADVIDNGMFNSPLFFNDSNADGMTATQKARVAQLVGQPVVPNSIKSGKVADQAFIGDDRGRIWQIDMRSKLPSEWKLKVFFDTLLAEHYPYRDCLSKSSGDWVTPTGSDFTKECCDTKTKNGVAPECTVDEKKIIFQSAGRTKEDFGIDQCAGRACTNPSFPFPRIPMLAPPTIVQDDERNNVLIFGTGQIDGLETLDHHRVFSVTQKPEISMGIDDKGDVDETNDETTSALVMGAPQLNWWIGENYTEGQLLNIPSPSPLSDIEEAMFPDVTETPTHAAAGQAAIGGFDFWGLGEKLLGRVFVFNKVAYFASFSPLTETSQNACDDGGSKIWGVNYNTLEIDNTRVFDKLDPDANGTLAPFVVYPGEVFTGLRLVRRPSCGGREGFTLVAQKANPDAPATPSNNPSADAAQIVTESLDLPVPDVGFTRVGIDSWSIVMGGE